MTCQVCGASGYTAPVVELRALLCVECDQAFTAWRDTHPWCVETDWSRWVLRGRAADAIAGAQRARDDIRDRDAAAASLTPMRPDVAPLYAAWRQHRQDVTA